MIITIYKLFRKVQKYKKNSPFPRKYIIYIDLKKGEVKINRMEV